MITGWDKTGPALYYVDNDGTRLKGQRFSVGSGSTYAYGVLDSGYKYDMEVDEACELGRRSVYHATHRDAYSGGIINGILSRFCAKTVGLMCFLVYHVTQDGWRKVSSEDCFHLHHRYNPKNKN